MSTGSRVPALGRGTLIIAEKPSVARAIRDAMGVGDYQVTNCFGHLFELAPPDAYDPQWKGWSLATLPIRVKSWRRIVRGDAKKQYEEIRRMLSSATCVIHAGDPDREGQLLVDEVLEEAGWRGQTQRVLLSAVDPTSIKRAFSTLKDNKNYSGLSASALARQRADWLVGMNMSRAVTKGLADGPMVSIGRVQTPTLALVVRRQQAIDAFVPQTFYTLLAQVAAPGVSGPVAMKAVPDPVVGDARVATALAKAMVGRSAALGVTREQQIKRAPPPFDLPSFQKAAEMFYGWPVARSLEILQKAYEAKLTSYPRSDCRYLPAEQAQDALRIAHAVASGAAGGVVSDALLDALAPSPRIYDTSKVAEHHGIIPTGLLPATGTPDDVMQAWRLVCLQFLASLLPDMKVEATKVAMTAPTGGRVITELVFKASGEARLSKGFVWKDLDMRMALGLPPAKKKDEPDKIPSGLKDGAAGTLETCDPVQGTTTPPEPYTEASLIADMGSVAKYVTDEQHKKSLKESAGIGTAATQAGIIETLKQRGFIEARAGKGKATLRPTELGVQVIAAIPAGLADPVNTAVWEDNLKDIAASRADAAIFMDGIERAVNGWLAEVKALQASGAPRITAEQRPSAAGPKAKGARGPAKPRKSPVRSGGRGR